MIRTGDQYRDSIRDNREVYMNGERVKDVTRHPMFKPLVDIRARIYDMAHDSETADVMTVEQDGEVNAVGNALPYTQEDWWAKRRATDTVLETIGGVVTRVGDETVGEMCMWSRKPMLALSCGARNMKRQQPMPIRPSPSPRLPIGAMRKCPTMLSASSVT